MKTVSWTKAQIHAAKTNTKPMCMLALDKDNVGGIPVWQLIADALQRGANIEILAPDGVWIKTVQLGRPIDLLPGRIYRVASSWKPPVAPPKVQIERCPVTCEPGRVGEGDPILGYKCGTIEPRVLRFLSFAVNSPDFIAYEYADGGKSLFPRRVPLKETSLGKKPVEFPVAVLFKATHK